MRKYLSIMSILITANLLSFSQSPWEIQRKLDDQKIDNMKKMLSNLRGKERVDSLNSLADDYFCRYVNYSWKEMVDSSWPIAVQANIEAKRINYRKGLGYSFMRMAIIKDYQFSDHLHEENRKYIGIIDTADQNAKQAILIGEELNDNILLGSAYLAKAWAAEHKEGFAQYVNYLKKAISFYEKTEKQIQPGVYRQREVANCNGCVGNELWLARLHRDLAGEYLSRNQYIEAKEHVFKAIEYYQTAGQKSGVGSSYEWLASIHFRSTNSNNEDRKDAFKKAISNFHDAGDLWGENASCMKLTAIYLITGDFENAFIYCKRGVELAEELTRKWLSNGQREFFAGHSISMMGELYKIAGDYETALYYQRRALNYYPTDSSTLIFWSARMGDIHRLLGNYDSAMYYLNTFNAVNAKKDQKTIEVAISLGKLYISLKQFDKGLSLIKILVDKSTVTPQSEYATIGVGLTVAANLALGNNDYKTALNYAREGLAVLIPANRRKDIMYNYEVISKIFHKLNLNDSAYYYLQQHTALKDSILNRQFLWRLNSYKKEVEEERKTSQIDLLNKENQLKQQQLKEEATLKKGLLAGLILILLLSVFIVRNLTLKRKNELQKQKLESEKKQVELEMQALRAQMNPHFIFNCLSSINRFILKNETKTASNYLTRFSRLMRMVLNNSQKPLIALEDELEMLELYLEMERLRFKNSFDYGITYLNKVDSDNIFIPPLLLQPFCENAIWHGLMHLPAGRQGKDGQGRLDIELRMDDKVLNCIITDNGIGREKAEQMRSKTVEKEKSMGLKITTERLALLNREKGLHTFYQIEDLEDENGNATGTRVTLKISFKESVEEVV